METNTRVCAYCQSDKIWQWSGKKLKDGSKIYVDGSSSRWSGRRCPDCERERVHAAVRCDSFERDVIVRQFEANGFRIKSKTLPLRVEKDGKTYTVGIKRAFTEGNKIVLETPVDDGPDIYALVFESVRICTADQMDRLTPNLGVYKDPSFAKSPPDRQLRGPLAGKPSRSPAEAARRDAEEGHS